MASRPLPTEHDASDTGVITPTAFRPPGALRGLEWPAFPWVPLALIATVLLTALAMGYLILARSVAIETVPAEAELEVGRWFAPRLGSHWLLTPGAHAVHARATGYKPLSTRITVTTDTLQAQRVTLTPLPGRLTIGLSPATKATVRVDGKRVGSAPGTIDEVEAGTRSIEISAARYLPFTATVEVRGKRLEETLEAKLTPAWADFTLSSTPAGANLRVDGEALGATPYQGELIHGTRKISVSLKGYKPWARTINVVAGQAVAIPDVTLAKADGLLEIVTHPPGAAITVDGRFRGEAPSRIAVSPDRDHRVTVMKAGYAPRTATARAAPDEVSNLALQLEPELADINLITEPADAELLVNGQPAGNATQRLSLPTHEHEIIVRKAGYATYRTVVTPRKGIDKHLRITLKTAAQMAAEAAPAPAAIPPPAPPPPAGTRPAPETVPAPSDVPPPLQQTSEAQQSVDIAQNPFIPDEIRAEAEAALRAPPPAGEGEIRTSLGQTLRRFDGGALTLPQRPPARLTRPFYLGLREVTNAEYRRFISSHVSRGVSGQDLNADRLPAVGISWEAAATYCNWLSRRDSLPVFYQIRYGRVLGVNPAAVGYRLPTEAEWDWAAARGAKGEPLQYPWGSGFPPRTRAGNFADESAKAALEQVIRGYDDGFAASAPVGSFPPNPHGLYDLAGNAAEWMHDAFAPAPADGQNPLGPSNGAQHVVRGASWAHASDGRLRAGHRESSAAPRPDLGFRIARYLQ